MPPRFNGALAEVLKKLSDYGVRLDHRSYNRSKGKWCYYLKSTLFGYGDQAIRPYEGIDGLYRALEYVEKKY